MSITRRANFSTGLGQGGSLVNIANANDATIPKASIQNLVNRELGVSTKKQQNAFLIEAVNDPKAALKTMEGKLDGILDSVSTLVETTTNEFLELGYTYDAALERGMVAGRALYEVELEKMDVLFPNFREAVGGQSIKTRGQLADAETLGITQGTVLSSKSRKK